MLKRFVPIVALCLLGTSLSLTTANAAAVNCSAMETIISVPTYTVPAGSIVVLPSDTGIIASQVVIAGILTTEDAVVNIDGEAPDLCIESPDILVTPGGSICTGDGRPGVDDGTLLDTEDSEGSDGSDGGDLTLSLVSSPTSLLATPGKLTVAGTICTGPGGGGGKAFSWSQCIGTSPGTLVSLGGTGGDGGLLSLQHDGTMPQIVMAPGAIQLGSGGDGGMAAVAGETFSPRYATAGGAGDSQMSYFGTMLDESTPPLQAQGIFSTIQTWIGSSEGGDGGDALAVIADSCQATHDATECLAGSPFPEQPTLCLLNKFYDWCYYYPWGIDHTFCEQYGILVGAEGDSDTGAGTPRPPGDGQVPGDPADTDPNFSWGCEVGAGVSYPGGASGGAGCSASVSCDSETTPATAGGTGFPGFEGTVGDADATDGGFGLLLGGRGGSATAVGGPGGLGGPGGNGGAGMARTCGTEPGAAGGRGGVGGSGGVGAADAGNGGPSWGMPGAGGSSSATGGAGGDGGPGGNGGVGPYYGSSPEGCGDPANYQPGGHCDTLRSSGVWGCGGPGGVGGAGIAEPGLGGQHSWVPVLQGPYGQDVDNPGADKSSIRGKSGSHYGPNSDCPT